MKRLASRSLASCIGLLLVAASSVATPRPLRELLEVVPSDAVGVAVVQWAELRNSTIYRRCEELYAFGHDRMAFAEVARLTGIDPSTDVDTAMVVARAVDGPVRGGLGILAGRFDAERIGALLAAEKGVQVSVDPREDARVYRLEAGGDRSSSLAFAGDGLLIFGDAASVDRSLAAVARSGDRLAPDSGLMQAFDSAPRTGEVWGAIEMARILPTLRLPDGGGPPAIAALKSLNWVSFNAEFGADLALVVTGVAHSAEEADLVRQAIDGAIAFGKLGAKDNPELLTLLAETTIERSGERVTFRTVLGPETFADLGAKQGSAVRNRDPHPTGEAGGGPGR